MEDQRREGITFTKILQLFRLFLPKNSKTLTVLKKFTDFDPEKIHRKYGRTVKGIILDVDDTISTNRGNILPANLKHIEKLRKKGIGIVLMSNMIKTPRYDVLHKDIKVMTNFAPKPEAAGFLQAIAHFKVPKQNIVMVGDNYITDGGAIRLGIPFIRVEPVNDKRKTLAETIHSAIRRFYILLSRLYQRN